MGFSFSPNTGRLLENLAFLALRRRTREIYYYAAAGGNEVDFYLPESRRADSGQPKPGAAGHREREVRALTDAMRGLGLDHGLILTDSNEAPIIENGLTIEVPLPGRVAASAWAAASIVKLATESV